MSSPTSNPASVVPAALRAYIASVLEYRNACVPAYPAWTTRGTQVVSGDAVILSAAFDDVPEPSDYANASFAARAFRDIPQLCEIVESLLTVYDAIPNGTVAAVITNLREKFGFEITEAWATDLVAIVLLTLKHGEVREND